MFYVQFCFVLSDNAFLYEYSYKRKREGGERERERERERKRDLALNVFIANFIKRR